MQDKIFYVCKYTPIELIESYGLKTERLEPKLTAIECCDALTHPNLCGYGKAVIGEILNQNIKALFLVDCCDVCRRIYDIAKAKGVTDFLFLMHLPHKNGELEVKQLKKELERLNECLKDYSAKDFDEKKVRELWQESIKNSDAKGTRDAIILTGAHGGARLKNKIEGIMSLEVVDDTCTGNRKLAKMNGGEFLYDYAHALLCGENPCMRMQFERETEQKGVGTICHTIKFCDYYSFQYKNLKSKDQSILKIETDCTGESEGQIDTRLEAFRELIAPNMTKSGKISGKYVCGIDSGSSSTNAVIMDEKKRIAGYAIVPTGSGVNASGERAYEIALQNAGLNKSDVGRIITTGYGRKNIDISNSEITEITCHAKGAKHLFHDAGTVIDIGGQDSKVIVLDENGDVINFVMNDKCAAGTGRFLETMAKVLEMDLSEISTRGLISKNSVMISNTCTVFAESEVISLIANNTPVEDIINGLNESIAQKTAAMVKRAKGRPKYIMTGGVANNEGVVKALEKALGEIIYVPKEAQLCGAIGAALFALE